MVNEHNAFDLAGLINNPDKAAEERASKVDLSGRPAPKGVRVQLDSGVTVICDVRYDGIDLDGQRKFAVIAEFDWENYHPKVLWVDEYPRDVTLVFNIAGMPDDQAHKVSRDLVLKPWKIIEV